MTRNRLVATIVGLALALTTAVPVSAARAQGGGGDNTAVAVNTKDGSDVFRLAFHVDRVASDTVDSTNAAVAFASCSECQTVAIAIQVVLIMSDATEVTPENLAIAVNQECSECDTLASAYQLVLTTGGRVRLTPEGRRRITDIRRQLQELRRSDLSSAEIQAQVKTLTTELRDVVTTQLVPVGRKDDKQKQGTTEAPSGPTTSTTAVTGGISSSTTSTTSTSRPATTSSSTTSITARATTSTTVKAP